MSWFKKKYVPDRRGTETYADRQRTLEFEQSQQDFGDTALEKMREGKNIRGGTVQPASRKEFTRTTSTKFMGTNIPDTKEGIDAKIRIIDPVQDFLGMWETQEHLFDTAPAGDIHGQTKRETICSQCHSRVEEAKGLGIDIMSTSLCQKCANEGYLARF